MIGQAVFTFKELAESKAAEVHKQMRNPKAKFLDKRMQDKNSTVSLRYELVEQSNTVAHMKFSARDFSNNQLFYKMSRSRDMGEFVPIYLSEKSFNDVLDGCKWEEQVNLVKDLCHND